MGKKGPDFIAEVLGIEPLPTGYSYMVRYQVWDAPDGREVSFKGVIDTILLEQFWERKLPSPYPVLDMLFAAVASARLATDAAGKEAYAAALEQLVGKQFKWKKPWPDYT